MSDRTRAVLALEDGTVMVGTSCGAEGETTGTLTFDTTSIGYFEVITDPATEGRITLFTYPQIGNYGVARSDAVSDRVHARGVVVREMCFEPSNFRSETSLPELLTEQGVVAIEGVDTRALTRILRTAGPLRAVISTIDADSASLVEKARNAVPIAGMDLVSEARTSPLREERVDGPVVALVDCGAPRSLVTHMVSLGLSVTVASPNASVDEITESGAVGVVFAGGPGDATKAEGAVELCRSLLGRMPILGVGAGLEILGVASGGRTVELDRGHHGGNYPVRDFARDRTAITAQNRGFTLDPASIEGRADLTHVNLNDGSIEGISVGEAARAVGFMPLATEGPNDARYIWEWFVGALPG